MRKTIVGITAAVVMSVVTPVTASVSHEAPIWKTRPCEFEHSANCYWDAGKFGNGEGHSFWSIKRKGQPLCTVYWENAYHRRNGYCSTDARIANGWRPMSFERTIRIWERKRWCSIRPGDTTRIICANGQYYVS